MLSSRRFVALIVVFVLFVFQNFLSLLFPSVPFPFMICAVVFYALSEGAGFGLVVGLWSGMLLETFVTGKFGLQMGLWGTVGFSVGVLSSNIFPDSIPAQLFLPLLAQIFVTGANLTLRGRPFAGPAELFMTVLLAPILFRVLSRRRTRLSDRQRRA